MEIVFKKPEQIINDVNKCKSFKYYKTEINN